MAKTKHTEKDILKIYHEALDGAWTDGIIDSSTIDLDKLCDVLRTGFYDSIVNRWMLIEEIVMNSPRTSNNDVNKKRKLSKTEINKLIDDIHSKLRRIPIDYEILVTIPKNYPLENDIITESVRVITISEKDSQEYTKANSVGVHYHEQGDITKNLAKNQQYLSINDSGFIKSAKNMSLDGRHDPIRIFRLFMMVHMMYGNLEINSLLSILSPSQNYYAKAYDKKIFTSVINNLVSNESKISRARFKDSRDIEIAQANAFLKLILKENTGDLEKIRVQVTNSLYWFFEYLNTDDIYLQIVYLVSAFDSLFSIKNSNVPNMDNIAPVIAEAVSDSFTKREKVAVNIRSLYPLRNKIIHGGLEIQNLRRNDRENHSSMKAMVNKSEQYFMEYIEIIFSRYKNS